MTAPAFEMDVQNLLQAYIEKVNREEFDALEY
jgi:hypothetical protein